MFKCTRKDGHLQMVETSELVTCRVCERIYTPSVQDDFYPDDDDPTKGRCERCLFAEVLKPKPRDPVLLPSGYEDRVCKKGQGAATCCFLGMGGHPTGMKCLKGSDFEPAIRENMTRGTMRAKGDNCSGPPEFKIVQ